MVLLSAQIDYFLVQLTTPCLPNINTVKTAPTPTSPTNLITLQFSQPNIGGVYTTISFDLQSPHRKRLPLRPDDP